MLCFVVLCGTLCCALWCALWCAAIQGGLSRDQQADRPLIVMYALVGNDVCNGHNDTVAHMTTPEVSQVTHWSDTT